MRTLHTLIGILAMASLASCTSAQQTPETTTAVTINESTPCDALSVSVGQILTVSLEGNPSTGYTWEAVHVPVQLSAVGDATYKQNDAPQNAVGVGGVTTWTYKTVTTGTGTLQFHYHRPWENVAPLKTFICSVTVR